MKVGNGLGTTLCGINEHEALNVTESTRSIR
jgi:hypothetical protein